MHIKDEYKIHSLLVSIMLAPVTNKTPKCLWLNPIDFLTNVNSVWVFSISSKFPPCYIAPAVP